MPHALIMGLLIPLAYVVGGIPFGLIVGLSKGVDPRKSGSGNIGATNVGRLLGGRYFAIVFILDVLKGLLPTLAAGMLLMRNGTAMTAPSYALWLAVGFAVVAGHMFSPFLGFSGGKGVATSLGMVLGVWPFYTYPGLVAAAAWAVIFRRTRIVSLASIIAAMLVPIAYVGFGLAMKWPILGAQWPLLAFAVFVALLIVWKHRGNIARLRAGTENTFRKDSGLNLEGSASIPPR